MVILFDNNVIEKCYNVCSEYFSYFLSISDVANMNMEIWNNNHYFVTRHRVVHILMDCLLIFVNYCEHFGICMWTLKGLDAVTVVRTRKSSCLSFLAEVCFDDTQQIAMRLLLQDRKTIRAMTINGILLGSKSELCAFNDI